MADIDPFKDQLSPQERFKVQLNFLNLLYKAADEIEKLWYAEDIN
jgi:hypothetical protein